MEWESGVSAISRFLLPSFFALSGFLVAGSLERCRTISAFVGLRMIRIFPALAVEVTLSALIMGPLVSALSFKAYIIDPDFRRYFLNLFGEIHYVLPGVFGNSPEPLMVNAQLWTIPYELMCYVTLTILVLFGLRHRRAIVPLFTVAIMALFLLGIGALHHWDWDLYAATGIEYRNGFYLICSFLSRLTIYLYRTRIKLSVPLIAVAVAVLAFSTLLGGPTTILYPVAAAYLTVAMGLSNPRRVWILQGADYSYGIYLYHYVIFQVVAQFFPNNGLAVAAIGLPFVVLFSAFSWHVVEKPAMELRKPLMAGDKGSGAGNALLISAFIAATIIGFTISYNLYPFFNPVQLHASSDVQLGHVASVAWHDRTTIPDEL